MFKFLYSYTSFMSVVKFSYMSYVVSSTDVPIMQKRWHIKNPSINVDDLVSHTFFFFYFNFYLLYLKWFRQKLQLSMISLSEVLVNGRPANCIWGQLHICKFCFFNHTDAIKAMKSLNHSLLGMYDKCSGNWKLHDYN